MQLRFGAIREFRPRDPHNPEHVIAAYNAATLEHGQNAQNFRPEIESQKLEGKGFGPYRLVTEKDWATLSSLIDDLTFSDAAGKLCGSTHLQPVLYAELEKAIVDIFFKEADARGKVEKYVVDDTGLQRVEHFDSLG